MDTKYEAVNSDKALLDDSELPPSYGESSAAVTSPCSHARGFPPPTNFLYRSRRADASLRGSFTIDPSLEIHPSLLPPLSEGEAEKDRKNLSFSAQDGNIVANVMLLPSTPLFGRRRTHLAFATKNGAINVKLCAMEGTTPYLLDITSHSGEVAVRLPPSFHGLLRLSSSTGKVSLSSSLSEMSAPLSELDGADTWFVGDLSSFGREAWAGSEVIVRAKHSNVTVCFGDADETPASSIPISNPPLEGKKEVSMGFWRRFRRR